MSAVVTSINLSQVWNVQGLPLSAPLFCCDNAARLHMLIV